MSTLATNKIGTLAGTADMSLPTTRPSQTHSAFLDSAGNLTFEDSSIAAEFFVSDGTTFVSSVLIDTAYLTSAGFTNDTGITDSTPEAVYGVKLGMWNLPDAIKTNYLSTTNIRSLELIGAGVGDGSSNSTGLKIQILDNVGDQVFTANQNMSFKFQTMNGSSGASSGGAGTTSNWDANPTGNNTGGYLGYQDVGASDDEGMPWSVRTRIKTSVNYGFRIDSWTTISYTNNQGPAVSYTRYGPRSDNTIDDTNLTEGGPWKQIGGVYVGTNNENSSYAGTGSFGSFTLKALIKPTAVVVA